jgi:chemotaxis signal transduction protein
MKSSTVIKPAIGIEEARRRLRISEESLQAALADSPERIKAVFRKRALLLAKERVGHKPTSKGISTLVVHLGQEAYAIALTELAEVVSFQGCTQVPGTSPPFLGVMNLRGQILPVIDLASVLSGSPSADSGALLILRRQVALKVDALQELRAIFPEEFIRTVQTRYLLALAPGNLGLLDIEAILSAVLVPKESRSK